MYDYDADLAWNKQRLRRMEREADDIYESMEDARDRLRKKEEDIAMLARQIEDEESGV